MLSPTSSRLPIKIRTTTGTATKTSTAIRVVSGGARMYATSQIAPSYRSRTPDCEARCPRVCFACERLPGVLNLRVRFRRKRRERDTDKTAAPF